MWWQGAGGGGGQAAGPLDFLRNEPRFQTLRSLVQQNPQILQPMLQVNLHACCKQSQGLRQTRKKGTLMSFNEVTLDLSS